jgi:hypothetical protein
LDLPFLPEARKEFLGAVDHYESTSSGLGGEFITDVEDVLSRIRVTGGSRNLPEDLGLRDSDELLARSRLTEGIKGTIEQERLTQPHDSSGSGKVSRAS